MDRVKVIRYQDPRKAWFLAARPKTLFMSFIPVIAGNVLAFGDGFSINLLLAFLTALSALFIQIGTNYVNDCIDYIKGADTVDRLGPDRASESGWLTPEAVLRGGVLLLFLAVLFGIPLILIGGVPLLLLVLVSPLLGYCYTGGPYPIAYIGLAEIFVIAFFGLASTSAAYFLQTGQCSWGCLLCGLQLGLLACTPVSINNLRDIYTDAKVGKKTLAVRFGKKFARFSISLAFFLPYLLNLLWVSLGDMWVAILPFMTFGLAFMIVNKIWATEPSKVYNQFLALAALNHLLFGFLICIGVFLQ